MSYNTPMATLPPLPALRAFEATIRLGGLARAAAELNISTSAVSHQLRTLEESLGARLVDRRTGMGGVQVTAAGATLLPAAIHALALLTEACAAIRGEARQLTVSANAPFSALWLAQRLAEFSALHPETPLNAIVQDAEPDFARHGIDLAVVNVRENDVQPDDVTLVQEEVFPVCSPELYPLAVGAVCKCRLLQEMHSGSPEIDWRSWAANFGLPNDFETKIIRYTSFSQVIGAALGGAGLALGRSPLIDAELASGRLVRLAPGLSRMASWRFVLRRGPGRRHPMVEALVTFLAAEAAGPRGTPAGTSAVARQPSL